MRLSLLALALHGVGLEAVCIMQTGFAPAYKIPSLQKKSLIIRESKNPENLRIENRENPENRESGESRESRESRIGNLE